METVKKLLLKPLLLPRFPAFLKYVQRDCATVFMLHRFEDPERGIAGCSVSHLRGVLEYLVRNNYELISVLDLFERLEGNGPGLRGSVTFTVDDGYVDQAEVAAPVFAEFGCPVTTFVSTGFLDGRLWFWWDHIDYVFQHATSRSVRVQIGETAFVHHWENEEQRSRAQADFTGICKRVSDEEKSAAILQLARVLEVEIPETPPPHCAPMSWNQVRMCEAAGMTFGPHSVTHPILSRTTQEAMHYEITESWSRLCVEAHKPVPIFCYPNGGWDDFGEREMDTLRRQGFLGAFASEPGYASARLFQHGAINRFRVQRFGFPDELPHLIQYVSGVERFKQILRSV